MALSGSAGGRITAGVGANLIGQHSHDRNQEATVYVGNLDESVTDDLVWEVFTQAGPVNNVYMPKDRVTNKHQGYGFVEFKGEVDADYAIKILNMIKLFGKPIRVNKASQDKKSTDVGANLFIGNLDPDVDEKTLYDTFSAFGVIVATPKIMRDPDTGISKGFGFVSYDSFEAADAAIEAMHGQFLQNRAITVGFAFKKDSNGERHGTPAERLLAASMRDNSMMQSRPHTIFSTGPGSKPTMQNVPEANQQVNGFQQPPSQQPMQPPLPSQQTSHLPPMPNAPMPPPPQMAPQPSSTGFHPTAPWLAQPQRPTVVLQQMPQQMQQPMQQMQQQPMQQQPMPGPSSQMGPPLSNQLQRPTMQPNPGPPPPWANQLPQQQRPMQMPPPGHNAPPAGQGPQHVQQMHMQPPGMGGSAMPPPPWVRPQGGVHPGMPPPRGMQPEMQRGMPLPPVGYSMARPPPMGLPRPPPGQQAPPNFPPRPHFPPRPVQY